MVACTPNPCTQPNRGVCTDVGGTAVCGCDVGYEDRQGTCMQSDPCQPNPCTEPHQGVCTAGADAGVSCACDPGYQPGASGCERIPPPTCTGQHTTGDTYEPDECPALAKDILSGVPQSHTVDPVGDVDFVKLSVDAGAVVRLEETSAFSASLTLYGTDGVTALQTASAPDRIVRKLPTAGTYFLRVRAASSSATGSTTIAFDDLGFDDQADAETGANTLNAATGGAVLTGAFEYPTEWDVLAVPVQAGHVYRFEESSSTDVYVRLAQGGTTLVATQDTPEAFQWRAAASGTVFFGIRHYSSGATGPWTMTVTEVGLDDHGDARTSATTVTLGAAATSGALQFIGDVDYFGFTAASGSLAFQVVTTGSVDVQVQNASGGVVASGTGPGTLTFSVPSAGDYYVRISRAALVSYTVRVSN
ncbi:MAG: PPC domain-containing protein [Myxococcota bacterium]